MLTVNKMDRCFLELKVEGEEAYQTFQRVIEIIMAAYEDPLLGERNSCLLGWGSWLGLHSHQFCQDVCLKIQCR